MPPTASSKGEGVGWAARDGPGRSQEADRLILVQRLTTPLKAQLLPQGCLISKGQTELLQKDCCRTCFWESPEWASSLASYWVGAPRAKASGLCPIHPAGTTCLMRGSRDGWLRGKEKGRWEKDRGGGRHGVPVSETRNSMTSGEIEIKGGAGNG